MAEPTNEFERRSFEAAGPVFLVALGLVLLAVLAVVVLFSALPGNLAWIWAIAGVASLGIGILWAASQRRAPGERRDGVP